MQTLHVVVVRSPGIAEINDVKDEITTIGGKLAAVVIATGLRGLSGEVAVMIGLTIEIKTRIGSEGGNETNVKDVIATETVKGMTETEGNAGANAKRTQMP